MNNRQRLQSGFTLVELLLIIGIIGVLVTIAYVGYQRAIFTGHVREAAWQVAADLRKARSQAQKQSVNTIFSFSPTAGNTDNYSLTLPSGNYSSTFENNIRMTCVVGCTAAGAQIITYKSPFGEMSSSVGGFVLELISPSVGIPSTFVKVIGVTGKVTVSASY